MQFRDDWEVLVWLGMLFAVMASIVFISIRSASNDINQIMPSSSEQLPERDASGDTEAVYYAIPS